MQLIDISDLIVAGYITAAIVVVVLIMQARARNKK